MASSACGQKQRHVNRILLACIGFYHTEIMVEKGYLIYIVVFELSNFCFASVLLHTSNKIYAK